MKKPPAEVQAYFDACEPEALKRLFAIRDLVLGILPEAEEAMKYGIPTFIYHGNLVHYAAFKEHTGFYPVPSAMEAFAADLAPYKQGKGSVRFPHNQDLPLGLIERMVRFRIAEAEAQAASRKKPKK